LEIRSNFDIQRSVHRDILSELQISWLCGNMMLPYRHKYCCIVSKQYIPETLWFTLYINLYEAKYSWSKQHAVLLNVNWYSFTDRLKLVRITWVHSKYHCEICVFDNGVVENSVLLRYDAALPGTQFRTFLRNVRNRLLSNEASYFRRMEFSVNYVHLLLRI
jgi:hypothetical protein